MFLESERRDVLALHATVCCLCCASSCRIWHEKDHWHEKGNWPMESHCWETRRRTPSTSATMVDGEEKKECSTAEQSRAESLKMNVPFETYNH